MSWAGVALHNATALVREVTLEGYPVATLQAVTALATSKKAKLDPPGCSRKQNGPFDMGLERVDEIYLQSLQKAPAIGLGIS